MAMSRNLGAGRSLGDVFPFGPGPFLILVLTVISGFYLLADTLLNPPDAEDATLTMWTFARQHYTAYENALPAFEAKRTDEKVDLQLVHGDTVSRRLRAAFWADLDVPDVVEVEITRAGSFFRGPVEDLGFMDLRAWLGRPDPSDPEGRPLMDRIVKARFSSYTSRGHIFGLPHDVHPVMLAYRRDVFEELGIDASKLTTWDDFVREGRRVTDRTDRYMINLSKRQAYSVEVFLFQRGGGYFDRDGRLTMDDERAVETIKWYVPLVAGPERIAADPTMFGPNFVQAVLDGYTLSFICPDWKSKTFETDAPGLAGKMALMPLPAFEPGGRRTSTWGGTMVGITKKCADPEVAWALVRHLYLEPEDLAQRFRDLNILPPYKDAWSQPAFHEKRSYWSGQAIGTEYIALAEQVPPKWGSPFLELASSKLGEVVAAAVTRYESRGKDGFDAFVRERLKQAADEVRRQMERNPF